MSNGIRLTKEGFEKLKKELDELRGPTRMKVAEAIREAKAHGDLRENAAYHEAKLNQQRLDARIGELEKALDKARIVDTAEIDGTAGLGARVKLKDLEFDDEFEVKLVGDFEADPNADLVSISSPLGEAIRGCTVGDEVEVKAPAGVMRYRVLAIE